MKTMFISLEALLATCCERDPPIPVLIPGSRLSRLLRDATPTQKALVTEALTTGALHVFPMQQQQALAITKASPTYAVIARRLSPVQRRNVERGAYPLGRVARLARQPDVRADRVIQRLGADRLLAALDRYTSPPRNGAASAPAVLDR